MAFERTKPYSRQTAWWQITRRNRGGARRLPGALAHTASRLRALAAPTPCVSYAHAKGRSQAERLMRLVKIGGASLPLAALAQH